MVNQYQYEGTCLYIGRAFYLKLPLITSMGRSNLSKASFFKRRLLSFTSPIVIALLIFLLQLIGKLGDRSARHTFPYSYFHLVIVKVGYVGSQKRIEKRGDQ
jgi:hypothetical protein